MDWLRAFLTAADKTPSQMAAHLGIGRPRVSEMLRGNREVQPREIAPLAQFLGVAESRIVALVAGKPDPGEPTASPHIAEQPQRFTPEPVNEGEKDIPVYASAAAGDGAIIITTSPIDYIRRSERMRGVKNPFAFYVIGHSMDPVIEHGDQVVVNPGIPVKAGRDCVFVQDAADGEMHAVVKRLVRDKGTSWRVQQFQPPKEYDLPKAKWPRAFLITEKRYS